jgi:hypothetical protein
VHLLDTYQELHFEEALQSGVDIFSTSCIGKTPGDEISSDQSLSLCTEKSLTNVVIVPHKRNLVDRQFELPFP